MAAVATAPPKRIHLEVTEKARRRYKLAAWLSIPTGLLGGLIKLGWEAPFPPRTAAQNATNPPQMFLEKFGFSSRFVHQTVSYNGYDIPWVSITVHMLFSIVVGGLIYILLAHTVDGLPRPLPVRGNRRGPLTRPRSGSRSRSGRTLGDASVRAQVGRVSSTVSRRRSVPARAAGSLT
jgi:hypothetical protein